jgi:pimeloyl-ACP methyl ester carboxylesterase
VAKFNFHNTIHQSQHRFRATQMTYCVLIHGTFSMRRWARDPNGPIRNAIRARVPTAQFEPFEWSGWHSQGARSRAAEELKARLGELRRQHEKIVVVGHSHGGNVALQAAQAFKIRAVRRASPLRL